MLEPWLRLINGAQWSLIQSNMVHDGIHNNYLLICPTLKHSLSSSGFIFLKEIWMDQQLILHCRYVSKHPRWNCILPNTARGVLLWLISWLAEGEVYKHKHIEMVFHHELQHQLCVPPATRQWGKEVCSNEGHNTEHCSWSLWDTGWSSSGARVSGGTMLGLHGHNGASCC